MRVAVVVLVLVGACGRFRFDEVAQIDADVIAIDAPPGHDEDGDGVPDIDDTCPHVAGAQTDSDGDRVGDLCDPEPMNPRQQLVLFDPMVNVSGFVQINGEWLEQGDVLRCVADGVYCQLERPFAFLNGVIEVGVDIIDRNMTATEQQATFAVFTAINTPHYYVEAFQDNGGAKYAALSRYNGSMFEPVSQQTLATGVHVGALTLRFTVTPSAPALAMYIAWPGEPYQGNASAPTPAYIGGPLIELGFGGITVDVRYLVVIATN